MINIIIYNIYIYICPNCWLACKIFIFARFKHWFHQRFVWIGLIFEDNRWLNYQRGIPKVPTTSTLRAVSYSAVFLDEESQQKIIDFCRRQEAPSFWFGDVQWMSVDVCGCMWMCTGTIKRKIVKSLGIRAVVCRVLYILLVLTRTDSYLYITL